MVVLSARRPLLVLLVLLVAGSAHASDDPVVDALQAEIQRAMEALAPLDAAPYYIAAELVEIDSASVRGEDGALHGWSPQRRRWLDVDVRIGDPQLDSTHPLRKESDGGGRYRADGRQIPLTDDVDLLRRAVWLEIDARYQVARDRWAKVQGEATTLVEEDPAPDLAPAAPRVDLQPPRSFSGPTEVWEAIAREASAELATSPSILDASMSFAGQVDTHWFVDSAGTVLRHSESRYRAGLRAEARADDGDQFNLWRGWDSASADGLPGREAAIAAAAALRKEVDELLAAPLQGPYNGPAILSDRAAGVFFHEVFGHRVEGFRLKQVGDGQTFKDRVGEAILPTFLSVYDDPTLSYRANADLRGHYRYDNQGVVAERVVLVQDGVLQGFLESRSPTADDIVSNGHGRRQAGRAAVARQGNLMVDAAKTVSNDELRRQLRELLKQDGLEYGLLIEEIAGGFTLTGRSLPNAFNVNAVVAWRIFADGRPDERVRGVDLIGTPLEAFGSIVAAGETNEVFNGNCGAESGWVPVSASAPFLLLRSVETQRKPRAQDTPPLLPPPTPGGAS